MTSLVGPYLCPQIELQWLQLRKRNWSGNARVYRLVSNAWVQTREGTFGDVSSAYAAADWAGWSVSLSGDGSRVAIGDPTDSADGTSVTVGYPNGDTSKGNIGRVRVYHLVQK